MDKFFIVWQWSQNHGRWLWSGCHLLRDAEESICILRSLGFMATLRENR